MIPVVFKDVRQRPSYLILTNTINDKRLLISCDNDLVLSIALKMKYFTVFLVNL